MSVEIVQKENITVVLRTYEKDGKTKKVRRTIGEITTFKGSDDSYFKKGEMYSMPGAEIDVYKQEPKEDEPAN